MPPPAPQEEEEKEDWLVTYADAITLLMAFFVMLLNFSKIDIPRFEEAAAGISEQIGVGPAAQTNPISILENNFLELVAQVEGQIPNMEGDIKVEKDDQGVVIELASGAFYRSGSANLLEQGKVVLAEIARNLMEPQYDRYVIEVEGHTDDDPISTARFPSNWELAAGRAAGVVRYFGDLGMERKRLKVSAFAETRPKVPNRTRDGIPIKENQAENRRVIIRAYPLPPSDEDELFREWTPEDYEPKGPVKSAAPPLTAPRTQAPSDGQREGFAPPNPGEDAVLGR